MPADFLSRSNNNLVVKANQLTARNLADQKGLDSEIQALKELLESGRHSCLPTAVMPCSSWNRTSLPTFIVDFGSKLLTKASPGICCKPQPTSTKTFYTRLRATSWLATVPSNAPWTVSRPPGGGRLLNWTSPAISDGARVVRKPRRATPNQPPRHRSLYRMVLTSPCKPICSDHLNLTVATNTS